MGERNKRQHPAGISGVLEIIIVLAALVVIGLAVWFAFGHKSGVKVGPVSLGKTFNDKCDYNDPNLCKFLNNFKTVKNFVITSSESGNVSTFKLDGDSKFQITTTTNGKEAFNQITIDTTAYFKDYSDNKWWKQTEDKTKVDETKQNFDFNSNSDSFTPSKTQYKFIAKEPCDKLMCFKYQVTEQGQDATEYIWFDDKEYLLRKSTVQVSGGAVSTLTYSYDKATVSAPSPTKDLAPGALPTGSGSLVPQVTSPSAPTDTSTDMSPDTSQ